MAVFFLLFSLSTSAWWTSHLGVRAPTTRGCSLEHPGGQAVRLHELLFILDVDSNEARRLKAYLKSKITSTEPTLEEELIKRAQKYVETHPRLLGDDYKKLRCNDVSFNQMFEKDFPKCKDRQELAEMINAVKYPDGTKVQSDRCIDKVAPPPPQAAPRPAPPVAKPLVVPSAPAPATPAPSSTPAAPTSNAEDELL